MRTTIVTLSQAYIQLLIAVWVLLAHSLFDPYRPERHYMRGPGPKWRAKHQAQYE